MHTTPVKDDYEFSLKEIEAAIRFTSEEVIGTGGFGVVYKGELSKPHGKKITVAIKRNDKQLKQGKAEFNNELDLVRRIHHQNIIPFVGYCKEGGELIIIYEYADHGSLDSHIREPSKRRSLSWVQRLKICLGAARAINHLHTGLGEGNEVIHRDVKSANILLDYKKEAKVCDFGYSRKFHEKDEPSLRFTEFAGTEFYIDPVYQESSILNRECDVYSFGVVLFEMLSGLLAEKRRSLEDGGTPEYLIRLVRRFYNDRLDRLIDPFIRNEMMNIHSLEYIETTSFYKIKEIAYQCISLDLKDRPSMGRIIEEIEEALDIQEKNHYLMECIIKDMGFSRGKPIAAFHIYKYLLDWESFEDENPRVFSRIIKMINLAVEKRNTNHYTAYWLSNSLALLFLVQGILKYDDPSSAVFRSSSSSVTIAKALAASTLEVKDPVIDFKQELTFYLAKLCCTIREKLKYDLGLLLAKVIQDPQTSRRGLKSDNWQNIVNFLSNTVDNTFKENFVPPRIVRMIFNEIFVYINMTLFNSIFEYPECCTFSNAIYLDAGLDKLDEWCSQYLGSASDKLMHLRQAVNFLVRLPIYYVTYSNLLFYLVSGLRINRHKSSFYGINLSPEINQTSRDILLCNVGQFPITYLGLVVGSNMNLIRNWAPVIQTFEHRLSLWKASTLSLAGRITLIRSVLDSLPSYFFSMYKAPVSVLTKLESIRKSFFWGGSVSKKKIPWVSWDRITDPIVSGGLGLGCLKSKNLSLLAKWWWRYRKHPNSLWGRTITALHSSPRNCTPLPSRSKLVGVWSSIANLNSHFLCYNVSLEQSFTGLLGNGSSLRFWIDTWCGELPFCSSFPDLFQLEKHKGCLVKDRCTGAGFFSQWEWNWSRPPSSATELNQFHALLTQIVSISISDSADSWRWKHDPSGEFTVKSMRNQLQKAKYGPSHWLFSWNKVAPLKANILCWRIEQQRIPTSDQLLLRNIPLSSPICRLCNLEEENATHLFLRCPLADSLWSFIQAWCQLPLQKPGCLRDLFEIHKTPVLDPRKAHLVQLIQIAFCWVIWRTRNDLIFSNKNPSIRFAAREIKSLSFLWLTTRSPSSDISWNKWNSFSIM